MLDEVVVVKVRVLGEVVMTELLLPIELQVLDKVVVVELLGEVLVVKPEQQANQPILAAIPD